MSVIVEISKAMPQIADLIDKAVCDIAGEPVAFSLFVWTHGRASYISTAARPEVITILKQMIEKWETGMPDVPAHEVH